MLVNLKREVSIDYRPLTVLVSPCTLYIWWIIWPNYACHPLCETINHDPAVMTLLMMKRNEHDVWVRKERLDVIWPKKQDKSENHSAVIFEITDERWLSRTHIILVMGGKRFMTGGFMVWVWGMESSQWITYWFERAGGNRCSDDQLLNSANLVRWSRQGLQSVKKN